MAHARLTSSSSSSSFEWLGRAPVTFEWLGQTAATDVPPAEVEDAPQNRGSTLKKDWTRAEMIMIGSLVLNAVWLTLYARSLARSRRAEAS